jgi:hypothetical protein
MKRRQILKKIIKGIIFCNMLVALLLQNISGIRLSDGLSNKVYDYDELAQVFVVQKPTD